MEVVIIHMTLD